MNANLPVCSLFVLFAAACGGGGGGGGAGGGGGGPIQPPTPPSSAPSAQQSGIVAAAAGSGTVRLDCRLPGTGFEAALFQGASTSTVHAGAPVVASVATSPVTVTGLGDGVDVFFGLGIRAVGATDWTPVGCVVRTRPGAPLFVDASANAGTADGLTPATAFPSLLDAMLVAGSQNGRNVWVRDGDYGAGPYPLGPNVHVAGGFGAAFDLATRDADGGGTRLVGTTTQEIVSVQSGGSDASLDGFAIDGCGTVLKGVDVVDADVELRSLSIRRCADRGVKAAVTTATPNRRLQIVGCTLAEHGIDGLSVAGPIDVRLDLSNFDGNGEEGADIDDLQAPDNGAVSIEVTGCRFFGNVFEGLDVDLAAAPLATGAGTFDVRIENCRFEVNGLDGLLVDQEHEAFPNFRAAIAVRGCIARANRLAGVHVDADANGTCLLERLRCTANAGDGVLVTSETTAGEVLLQSSWLGANLGTGARVASGNKVLLATHCGFFGNEGGGLRSDANRAAATNCVFLRQATPLTNADGAGNVTGSGAAAVFVNAPVAVTRVTALTGNSLTVADTSGFTAATSVAAGDDGSRLVVAQQGGTSLVLDSAPQAFVAPGALLAWSGNDVRDDLRLAAASPALGQGLAAPGDPTVDAGPHGADNGGEPGHVDPTAATSLQLRSVSPALATGLAANAALVLTFDRALDLATVTQDRVRVVVGGSAVTVGIAVNGATLTLTPTGAGWSGSPSLQLLAGLRATDGSDLAAAITASLRIL